MTRFIAWSFSSSSSSWRFCGIEHVIKLLFDAVGGACLGGDDLDALGRFQHVAHQLDDVVGHGGGEQHRLPLLGQMRHDLAHVADEAHVQHAVGFVDDEDFDRVEPDMLLLHQVEQAARRRHQDVDAMLHGVDLGVLADAAQDHGALEIEEAAIGAAGSARSAPPVRGSAPGSAPWPRAGGAAHGRWKASAAAAGRRRRSCRCRSGRCPEDRARPASAGMARSLDGGGMGIILRAKARRIGSATPSAAKVMSVTNKSLKTGRTHALRRTGTAVAVFHAHWRERRVLKNPGDEA